MKSGNVVGVEAAQAQSQPDEIGQIEQLNERIFNIFAGICALACLLIVVALVLRLHG